MGRQELFISREDWDPGAADSSMPLAMKNFGEQIPSSLSSPVLPPIILGQMPSRAFEVTKGKAHIFTFSQPSVILKVKWYYKRGVWVSMW